MSVVAGASEEEIYEKLGLAWDSPELRENSGEIEAAAEGRLPKLIEISDIRGDLAHAHHRNRRPRDACGNGRSGAIGGYEYIAITDHSKALAMANGLDEKRAVAFAHQVREMDQSGLGLRVFSGNRVRYSPRRRYGSGGRRARRARLGHWQRA